MNDALVYDLPGMNGLSNIMAVVKEIHAEMGMQPAEIRLKDGTRVGYNWKDAKALEKGGMDEEEYIERNRCSGELMG